MQVTDFKGLKPTFHLEAYFRGRTKAFGFFEDRFGRVRRQFEVDIQGTWEGHTLVMDENFKYRDGEVEHRHWEIRKEDQETYSGSAKGVLGKATGKISGNAFHWTYKFSLKIGKYRFPVKFDDWMFLQNENILLNKARVSFLGFHLGTVFLSFKKN